MQTFWGILIPFLGTTLGAACVFFMKKALSDAVQRSLTGFAAGVMVAASVWSLLIPAIEQSAGMGKLSFLPRLSGLLARHPVSARAGSHHPAPAREQRPGRRAEEPPAAHDDDGAGRDAAQHPGGHGRRRGIRRVPLRQRTDHGGRCAGPVAGHRHSELPGRGDHLHAAAGGGHEKKAEPSAAACFPAW